MQNTFMVYSTVLGELGRLRLQLLPENLFVYTSLRGDTSVYYAVMYQLIVFFAINDLKDDQ